MSGLTSLVLLLASGAPVPEPATPPTEKVDRDQALHFAGRIVHLANEVQTLYVRPLETRDLLEAAVRGLYEESGRACTDSVLAPLRRARTPTEYKEAVADARIAVGNPAALQGPRAYFAALNGFRYTTDSYTSLVSGQITASGSADTEFGIGLELEGMSGPRWTLYQLELGYFSGRFPPEAEMGRVPAPTPPITYPWRIRRIIPGSPSQRAGLLPGDVITHLNEAEITANSSYTLFRSLVSMRNPFRESRLMIRVQRTGFAKPLVLPIVLDKLYATETVFGVRRISNDEWDYMLDRENRIGYVRLGPVEIGTDAKLSDVLATLAKQDCQALILDLRWCPGGFVTPGANVAGLFLEDNLLITHMTDRNAAARGLTPDIRVHTEPGWTKFTQRPLVVLVGPETAGGGEMIAAAIQDHNRGTVIGQRTSGKGNVQVPFSANLGDLQLKVSTGYTLRPNGANRHRFNDSKPTDNWGVRPGVGCEIPMTNDLREELRKAAELHTLRPADSREALSFDDPARDPCRQFALTFLRKKLKP